MHLDTLKLRLHALLLSLPLTRCGQTLKIARPLAIYLNMAM